MRGRKGGVSTLVVAEWSQLLPKGATVLDIGSGTGVPISETLIKRGLGICEIDASSSMVAEEHQATIQGIYKSY
ncbi:MAG: hypothetical protein WAM39_26085 [Bryobacteraceae bacterium]